MQPTLFHWSSAAATGDDDTSSAESGGKNAPIETEGNNIYFYQGVSPKSVLALTTELRKTAKELRKAAIVSGVQMPPIRLHLFSYGGLVHAGLAAYDTIRTLDYPVETIVDGVAASAATLILSAGERRYAHENAQILIHQVSSGTRGTLHEMQDGLKNTEFSMRQIKAIYRRHTRLTDEMLDEILSHDLFLTAEEALRYGLLDEII